MALAKKKTCKGTPDVTGVRGGWKPKNNCPCPACREAKKRKGMFKGIKSARTGNAEPKGKRVKFRS